MRYTRLTDDEAAKMEREAQAAINSGHHDDVPSLRRPYSRPPQLRQ